jgi:hypothetical protein
MAVAVDVAVACTGLDHSLKTVVPEKLSKV